MTSSADHPVTKILHTHYDAKIKEFGPVAKGVDWGAEADVDLRYSLMLDVMSDDQRPSDPTLLDVGCGYGGLRDFAGPNLRYAGLDMVEHSLSLARKRHPGDDFILGDVLDEAVVGPGTYDYVVASGILTLKSTASLRDMDDFFKRLVTRMFAICRRGIAFNVMTNKVNYFSENLYYRSPVEVLAFCQSELSPKVRINHAYRLYEFTTYVYK